MCVCVCWLRLDFTLFLSRSLAPEHILCWHISLLINPFAKWRYFFYDISQTILEIERFVIKNVVIIFVLFCFAISKVIKKNIHKFLYFRVL